MRDFFEPDDLLRARDDSKDCGGTGSNHADVIYLNDVANAQLNGFSADEAANVLFPSTIAHELRSNRFLRCATLEEFRALRERKRT